MPRNRALPHARTRTRTRAHVTRRACTMPEQAFAKGVSADTQLAQGSAHGCTYENTRRQAHS
eukprot:1348300-Lingulodinium_polyedra.AAC.1